MFYNNLYSRKKTFFFVIDKQKFLISFQTYYFYFFYLVINTVTYNCLLNNQNSIFFHFKLRSKFQAYEIKCYCAWLDENMKMKILNYIHGERKILHLTYKLDEWVNEIYVKH